MALFHYKGRTSRGDAIEGEIEASNADVVATQLSNSGVIPVDIHETQLREDAWQTLRRRLGGGRAGLEDLILFSRQMYTLMRAGVPIIRSINSLAESTRNTAVANALEDVVGDLESGRELSGALGRHPRIFSSLFVSIVQVGESSGRLDEAFLQIAQYLELEKDTRDRIKAAMRYPMIVLIAIGAAIAIINLFVIPAFASVYKNFGAELPWATKLLIATSDFAVNYWPLVLAGIILGVAAIVLYVRTEAGRYRWHKYKLRIPAVGGIVLRATLARFARSFAMATRSGVPLIQALTVVARAVDNDFVGDRVLQMRNGIERGDSMTRTAASTGMFTPLVLQMLAIGEETGNVDELLQEVAGYYEREVDYDLKNLSDAIQPMLIVAIGVLVFILALGVFLPMWDLASAARGG